jgi:gamma-soluble NSF attachment protein
MAAKDMELAANIAAQQLKQPERAADLYRKASDLYQAHMTPDRAAEILEKGARLVWVLFSFFFASSSDEIEHCSIYHRVLEPVNVDEAIKMYLAACSLYESEDRGRFAIETFKKTIALMVRNKRFGASYTIY